MTHAWGYGSRQRLRDDNEDCHGVFRLDNGWTLALVCDGMGGQSGGGHASKLAVRTMHDALQEMSAEADPADALREAIQRSNKAIYDASRRSHEFIGMGTTVAAVLLRDRQAIVAHVGDSRVYLVRGEQVRQLSRDHTMVNLFVDAGLLSPEDAQSHPEAHVLSRTLGADRTVDVDVQDPLTLGEGDTLLLCTDGVHGVLAEWEIGKVGFDRPTRGVESLLDEVEERDAKDNATAIALTEGASSDQPPTTPPSPSVEVERATQRPVNPNAITAPGFKARPKSPAVDPDEVTMSRNRPARQGAPSDAQGQQAPTQPPPAPAPETKKKKASKGSTRRKGLAIAVLALGLLGGAGLTGIVAIVLLYNSGQPEEPTTPGDVAVEPSPDAQASPTTADQKEPRVAQRSPRPASGMVFYSPDLPPIVPEVHRPDEHTHPPPGGTYQVEAVRAARAGKCSRSLDTVVEAMNASIDFARLYLQAWECYTIRHREIIQTSEVGTVDEFANLLVHFEGPLGPEVLEQADSMERLWDRTALDGIEHRLAAIEKSDPERDMLVDVMIDYLGASTLAAELGRDVLLEAEAALAFSRELLPDREALREELFPPDPRTGKPTPVDPRALERAYQEALDESDPELVDWWARRVYISTRALQGRVGELLREHQPDVYNRIAQTLQRSLPGVDLEAEPLDNPRDWPEELQVPREVFLAYQAGLVDKVKPRAFTSAAAARAADMGSPQTSSPERTAEVQQSRPRRQLSAPKVYRHEDQ